MKCQWIILASAMALGIGLLFAAGCATTDDHRRDSDMPWNQPQPWEDSPFIPGMDRY